MNFSKPGKKKEKKDKKDKKGEEKSGRRLALRKKHKKGDGTTGDVPPEDPSLALGTDSSGGPTDEPANAQQAPTLAGEGKAPLAEIEDDEADGETAPDESGTEGNAPVKEIPPSTNGDAGGGVDSEETVTDAKEEGEKAVDGEEKDSSKDVVPEGTTTPRQGKRFSGFLPKVNLSSSGSDAPNSGSSSRPSSGIFDVNLSSVFRMSRRGKKKDAAKEEEEVKKKEDGSESDDSEDELETKVRRQYIQKQTKISPSDIVLVSHPDGSIFVQSDNFPAAMRPRTVRTASQEEEFTGFYAILLQTLLHPMGRLESVDCNPLELAAHCQKVFGVNNTEHSKLVKQELTRVPSSYLLKITVVEAKDIKSMDPNGLSDPYCLLALLNKGDTAKGDTGTLQHSVSLGPDQVESGALRSPGLPRKQNSDPTEVFPGVDGAEAFFKTEVQKETLHPVWNEQFHMEVVGTSNRILSVTIWDWDEETSLWSAVKGVEGGHKMAGVKNLFRHMKHGINKSGDDFIGEFEIPLADIPAATRVEKWYKLQRGSSKHHVSGQCRLRMQFTRKELDEADANSRFDWYNQLAGAVHTFEAEAYFTEKKKGPWDGKLTKLSSHLLDYFAVLQDVSKLAQLIVHLSCMLQYVCEYSSKKYLKKLVRMAHTEEKTSPTQDEQATLPGASSSLDQPNGAASNPPPPPSPKTEMGLAGKVPALLMDRVFREITYSIHAELMAALSPSEEEEGDLHLNEFLEKNPGWMDHELSVLDTSVHEYIDMCLKGMSDGPPLFPPGNAETLEEIQQLYRLPNIHTVLSMKIWPATHRSAHTKMQEALTAAVTSDTKKWLIENLKELPQQDEPLKPAELVMVIDEVIQVFSDLCVYCKTMKEYKNAFARFNVKYFSVVAKVTDNHLSKSLQDIIKRIIFYLLKYKRFPENISESSIASLRLYFTVKKLVAILAESIHNGDELDLLHYHRWFQEPLIYWLVTFQHEISQRVKMALEVDKEMELVHSVVKYSHSAVDVQACFSKVTQEWNSIGFAEPDSNCIAIARITEAICDGAKLYAHQIHSRLQEGGFYRTSPDQTFDIKDKLCITLNNIEHVRVYLDTLPNLLEWEKNVQLFVKQHNSPQAGKLTMASFHRLTTRASEDVHMMSGFLERNIAEKMCEEVIKYLRKLTDPATKSKDEVMDNMMEYIDDNLGTLYKQLLAQLFPRITKALWDALVRRFARLMKIGKPPHYYEELRESLNCLESYFHSPAIKLDDSSTKTPAYHTLVKQLAINSLSSERLMLQYCMEMSNNVRRPEESIGVLNLKIASREQEDGNVSVVVKVCNANDLPGMDRSGLSDPFVMVEICPETTQYRSRVMKSAKHRQTLNPEFNETFTFTNIPPEVFTLEGITLVVSIYDHDILWKDDFIGEAFLSVSTARRMEENQTVDQCPAIMLTLRRPKEQEGAFQILQARSVWEKYTRQFMAQRLKAIQNQKQRTDTPREKVSWRLRNSILRH